MARGKLKLEMIGDEKTRIRTFRNRSKGLKKKLHALSTLCDIEACMILYGPDHAKDVWPENRHEVERIVKRYFNERKEEGRGKRTLDLSDVFGSRKVEDEDDDKKGCGGRIAGVELYGRSYVDLIELVGKSDEKLEAVDGLIELRKRAAGLIGSDRSEPGWGNSEPLDYDIVHVLEGSEVVLYDQDLKLIFSRS